MTQFLPPSDNFRGPTEKKKCSHFFTHILRATIASKPWKKRKTKKREKNLSNRSQYVGHFTAAFVVKQGLNCWPKRIFHEFVQVDQGCQIFKD